MKSFKNYLHQQLHENQDSDNSYAKYGMPDNVDVIVNRGIGYDTGLDGNSDHATKYLSFVSSKDTDTLAKLAQDDYKANAANTRDGEVRTVTDPATGKSIQMTYGKDVAGRGMIHKIKVIPKTPAANTPAANTPATTPAPATATNTTRNLNGPEDPPYPGGTKFWSHDGKVHTEHATEVDMKAFSVKNPSQWTGAQTPDGSMHWKTPGTPHVTAPKVTAPKVRGAGVLGVITGPLIAAGTALLDKKSLAAAGGDAVEAAVNNLDPFITTTLGSNDVPYDSTPEEDQKDMDAANAQREKQDNDEAEKTKQNALNDTKSGNNSLNKTITDILSGAAKKNI